MGRWIHKGDKSKPDKRCKNVLSPKNVLNAKRKNNVSRRESGMGSNSH